MTAQDLHHRPLSNLRISVTDRCNLRCAYCMPGEDYVWLPREHLLDFEEIDALVEAFLDAGVTRVRLTGGEPLLRKDLHRLVERLAGKPRLEDLALTTNGLLLAEKARDLRQAGLHRLTVSLDTLVPERFLALTRRDAHADVLKGLEAAAAAGFRGTKIDAVLVRGLNDDEISPLLRFCAERGLELRFIEYMDVGGATGWSRAKVVTRDEILATVRAAFGAVLPIVETDPLRARAPAQRFALQDGTTFGIIASTTSPFCGTCDRARLTADGTLYLCLYAKLGLDLKTPLRAGASRDELRARIEAAWRGRGDRGAEERLRLAERGASRTRDELREDPRLEMHTRGG